MTQRITKAMLQKRLDILNDVFGYDREPYTKSPIPSDRNRIKGNHGTFIIDSAYGGHRLSQMSCYSDGTGERDLSPRGTARETYDIINAWIDSGEQMKRKMESK